MVIYLPTISKQSMKKEISQIILPKLPFLIQKYVMSAETYSAWEGYLNGKMQSVIILYITTVPCLGSKVFRLEIITIQCIWRFSWMRLSLEVSKQSRQHVT